MRVVEKKWGSEDVLVTNEHYTGKFLNITAGNGTSKQYHREKHETLYLLKGKAKVLINGVEQIFDSDKDPMYSRIFIIPPGTIHQTSAVDEDCVFVEFSTSQLEDVVHLDDLQKRIE